jgi:glycosyltransferase involved in cell wall biosynthesis
MSQPRPLLINGKWLAAHQTGVQRYSGEVARRILQDVPSSRVVAPADAVLPDWLPDERVIRSRATGFLFEQVALPWIARRFMLLNLAASAPLVTREQLVMMPDALVARYPETYSKRFVLWYRLMYRVLVVRARHIVTISKFSRSELADVLGVAKSRFVLAPAGHEHALDTLHEAVPHDAELESRMSQPYVLCVGSLTPSKNLAPVTRALAEAGVRVIVVGASGVKRVYAEESGLTTPGVWLAGRLSDAQLARLLSRATALVFPSFYEGFGLPVVEAQALACPVIASDRASIPEVAGDGALYFDPRRPQDAVALVHGLDETQRDRLIANGLRNVGRYSWNDTARTILGLVAEAAEGRIASSR